MFKKDKREERRLATEIVSPVLTILCGIIFLVWFFWPQSKAAEDAVSLDPSLYSGDFAYVDVVTVTEPTAYGNGEFLCKCIGPNGERCWFFMSRDDYSDVFTMLFTRQEGVYDMGEFTYIAAGTVRVYGTVREVPWYSESMLGSTIIVMEYMEPLYKLTARP